MPSTRFLQPGGDGYYHCVSRVVDRRYVFNTSEKRHFRKWMRKLETFCGVEVVTYCLMSNHFHILLRVPDKAAAPKLTAPCLRKLLAVIYEKDDLLSAEQELDRAVEGGEESLTRLLARYEARRHSLPVFMKELKQRFTRWFNRRHSRKGTLWEERYRSVLVEGDASALTAVAAYVDLNPVRAGLADSPEDYAWSGYAEACGGGTRARRGLLAIFARHAGAGEREEAAATGNGAATAGSAEAAGTRSAPEGPDAEDRAEEHSLCEALWPVLPAAAEACRAAGWRGFADGYRLFLFEAGVEIRPDAQTGAPGRRGFDAARVEAERRRSGRLPWAKAMRCKVRHFTDAAVLGSEGYLEAIFAAFPERFGPTRKSGARKLRGVAAGGLRCLRDLQAGM